MKFKTLKPKVIDILTMSLTLSLLSLVMISHFFLGRYDYRLFFNSLIALIGIGYVSFRASNGAMLPKTQLWPVVLGIYVYFLCSLFISGNVFVGIPRLLNLLALGIFFLIMWDGFDKYFKLSIVVSGLLTVTFIFMAISIMQVWIKYQGWWKIFGFIGEFPPILFRITEPFHANQMMALLNMLLPISLLLLFRAKSNWMRIAVGFWIFAYGIVFIFSSSRGGLVGFIVGLCLLFFQYFNIKTYWNKFKIQPQKFKLIIVSGLLFVLIIMIFGGYIFYERVFSHPTHGGAASLFSLNRGTIWLGAWRIFITNPIFGAGIGRFIFEFFQVNQHVPPGWFPIHSHNMFLGIFSEFGLVGGLGISVLLLLSGTRLVQQFLSLDNSENKRIAGAVIAGLGSITVHSFFEDFLYQYVVVIFACILIALLINLSVANVERSSRFSFLALVPILVIAFGALNWIAIPQRKIQTALDLINQNDSNWIVAAEVSDEAIKTAGKSHFYLTQSAHFWQTAWYETGEFDAIENASNRYLESLSIEPGLSWEWANKALASWYEDNQVQAIFEIDKAIDLAPLEPTYYLNKGWFYEQLNENNLAEKSYLDALIFSEKSRWYTHPFWKLTEVRRGALERWMSEKGEVEPSPDKAIDKFFIAINNNDYTEAEKILMRERWARVNSYSSDLMIMEGYLLLEIGDEYSALDKFISAFSFRSSNKRLNPLGFWSVQAYSVNGLTDTFMPGVLQLSEDYGQSYIFEDIFRKLQEKNLAKSDLCALTDAYNRWVAGGEIMIDQNDFHKSCLVELSTTNP